MLQTIPISLSISFIILNLALLGLFLKGIKSTLTKMDWEPRRKKSFFLKSILTLSAWIIFLAALGLSGFLTNFTIIPPRLTVVILPAIIGLTLLLNNAGFNEILAKIPYSWLIGLQSFRIFIELILWGLFVAKIIPIQMTFEGRNFDILVGLTAPLVALYVWKELPFFRQVATVWNILGLGLLINIVVVASLSAPSPMRFFMNEPANTMIAYFPFVWLPGFAVPIAYYLHAFSIKQMLAKTQ